MSENDKTNGMSIESLFPHFTVKNPPPKQEEKTLTNPPQQKNNPFPETSS